MQLDAGGQEGQLDELKSRWYSYLQERWLTLSKINAENPAADFPDIFSWLLDEMGELPLPRKERGTAIPNPLKLIGVPS
jgi:hypothetical protein